MNNFGGMYQQPQQANPYYPYTTRQMPYQPMQTMTPPQNQSNTNLDWIMVPTVQQVESVTVQPNQKAWIMVQNEAVFALKTADSVGLVSTDYYKFERLNEPCKQENPEYVTRAEMEDAIRSAINSMKGVESYEPIVVEDKGTEQPVTNERSRFPFKNEKYK